MRLIRGGSLLRGLMVGACLAMAQASSATSTPTVLATTGMVGDMVESLGGECIDTQVLMGPGVDPHLYRAAASDVRAFQQAALIAYNGFGLEGQLDSVLTRFGERRPTLAVAEAAAGREPLEVIRTDGGEAVDPHLWMDARMWAQGIAPTADALVEIAPDCATAIRDRASTLHRQLHAVDDWITSRIQTIPAPQRVLLTAHDAFRYYGRAYDIEVRGVQGISTTAEASVADIRANARLIAERGIPALFVETTINPRTVEAVVAAARERGADVRVGGALYGDALGASGTLADSVVGMLIHNTIAMTRALGGRRAPLPEPLAAWQPDARTAWQRPG